MKFLTDQDVYSTTIGLLNSLGHNVVTATQLGLSQAEDGDLLRIAQKQKRILKTAVRLFPSINAWIFAK